METINAVWSHMKCNKDSWRRITVALWRDISQESDCTRLWSSTGGGKGWMLLATVLPVPNVLLSSGRVNKPPLHPVSVQRSFSNCRG